MKTTIKIIDLLNDIANGREIPKKIRYNLMTEEYKNICYNEEEMYFYFEKHPEEEWDFSTHHLNDEVEILDRDFLYKELEKEIEKAEEYNSRYWQNYYANKYSHQEEINILHSQIENLKRSLEIQEREKKKENEINNCDLGNKWY